MRVDLHNHTTLCNHATGSMEEYIKKAIELKIDVYGFSCHGPMEFEKKYRMDIEQCENYENDIKNLAVKYKDKIEILSAYEVDYMLDESYILDEICKANIDYLIGSVHFLSNQKSVWGFDNPANIDQYTKMSVDKIYEDYFELIYLLAKCKKFDIVGHLDLIKIFKFKPKKDIKQIAKNALLQIKKSNMTIELNSAGFRKPIAQQYPSNEILDLAYELDIPITFSSDAHAIEHIGQNYDKCVLAAKNSGYNKCAIYRKRDRVLVDF